MSSNVLSREFIYNPCFLFSLREANKLHSIIKKRKQSDEQKPTYAEPDNSSNSGTVTHFSSQWTSTTIINNHNNLWKHRANHLLSDYLFARETEKNYNSIWLFTGAHLNGKNHCDVELGASAERVADCRRDDDGDSDATRMIVCDVLAEQLKIRSRISGGESRSCHRSRSSPLARDGQHYNDNAHNFFISLWSRWKEATRSSGSRGVSTVAN